MSLLGPPEPPRRHWWSSYTILYTKCHVLAHRSRPGGTGGPAAPFCIQNVISWPAKAGPAALVVQLHRFAYKKTLLLGPPAPPRRHWWSSYTILYTKCNYLTHQSHPGGIGGPATPFCAQNDMTWSTRTAWAAPVVQLHHCAYKMLFPGPPEPLRRHWWSSYDVLYVIIIITIVS